MDTVPTDLQTAAQHPVPKWKVPVIVVGIVTGVVVAGVLFFRFIVGWIKGTGAHKEAVAAALADARVRDRLGTPITEDWSITGTASFNGDSGSTGVESTLRGPQGTAMLVDTAWKARGVWHHHVLRVVFPGDPTPLDLCNGVVHCDPAPLAP